MREDIKEQSVIFRHLILEGNSYDIGKTLGQYIKSETDPIRDFTLNSPVINSRRYIQQAMEYFDKYCPEINDEITGLAEGLGTDVEKLLLYIATYKCKGCCSQMALLPAITKDKHILVARNYEYSPQESDLCLVTTKVNGKARHIGFSEMMFGRNDGINEHGLCISMTNAVPGKVPDCEGVDFWAIIRAVLDNCVNTDEAIELIHTMPTASYTNYIIADRKANVALVEVAGSEKLVQKIDNKSACKFLCTTNHFTSSEMVKYDNARYWDSVARYTAMNLRINESIPDIDKDVIKGIQSDLMPLGICCHYYTSRFGTLWSIIYDVSDINLEVCFGSPKANSWYTLDLNSSRNQEKYSAVLPCDSKKPLWKKLPPGATDCSEFEFV